MSSYGKQTFWNSIPTFSVAVDNEASVEARLVEPLLHVLGYQPEDIAPKYPVQFQEGRKGRKPEADYACFYGSFRTRDNSLLVVEAKSPDEPLPDGKAQGESYAQNLRAPLLLLTNGVRLEIWQMQISKESICILACDVRDLANHRSLIESSLSKISIYEYCRSLSLKTIADFSQDFGAYEAAEYKRLKAATKGIYRTLKGRTGEQSTVLVSNAVATRSD